MLELIRIAERAKITIDDYDLGNQLLGLYLRTKATSKPVILLHKHLPSTSPVTRCVLAEELGHHFTMSGDSIYQHRNYGKIIQVSKIEKAALRWAGNVLIPADKLAEAIIHGETCLYRLAHEFNVTEQFMAVRMQFFNDNDYKRTGLTLRQRLSIIRTTAQLAGSFLSL